MVLYAVTVFGGGRCQLETVIFWREFVFCICLYDHPEVDRILQHLTLLSFRFSVVWVMRFSIHLKIIYIYIYYVEAKQ